eukprot:TRINITY_DN3689_c0_g3_i2.p1 TRINITY_DN3689_c0_g3~~TRINITY_DN3689_c0_g3_i2.p1  ORF type:complete len:1224 (-),score=235.63 TRINITY_DN3689_c0_g3_i2:455-4126(-)
MSFKADQIIERMNQRDPDFRYMAVSDLHNECLREGFKLDGDSESKIVSKLLKMIAEDSSGDVKGMAVKCLAPLSTKLSEKQIAAVLEGPSGLTRIIFSSQSNNETKDIATIGLKYIIAQVPAAAHSTRVLFINRVVPKLTEQIQKASTQETVWFCLDIVNDLLGRWGREMSQEVGCFEKLQTAVLPHLNSENARARKKASGCLGYLSASLPDPLLNSLTEHLIKSAKAATLPDAIQTYVQTIAEVSRSVGSRIGKYMKDIIYIISKHTRVEETDAGDDDLNTTCEIKDNCFQVLEALLLRCTRDTDRYYDKIEGWCLNFLTWDPLVNDDYDADPMEDEDEEFMNDSDEVGIGDDMSWKVRKASARCITVIIKTRPEKLPNVCQRFLPTIVSRIVKEREENVKLDLMSTVVEAFSQTAVVASYEGDIRTSVIKRLTGLVPDIVKGLQKELVGKSPKTKIGAFQLLRELVVVLPDALDVYITTLVPGIQQALDDKAASPLKIEALSFLRSFMAHKGSANVFVPHLEAITPFVLRALSDSYYKINGEALRVLTEIIKIYSTAEGFDPTTHLPAVFEATSRKLSQPGVDQEVKEGAIECAGLLVSLLGDKLSENQISSCLKNLVEFLSNEATWLPTVRILELIASSKLRIDLSCVLDSLVKDIAGFLRKKSRPLRQSSLLTLTAIVKSHGKSKAVTSAHFELILKEVVPLISEQDLLLSHLSLLLVSTVVHVSSSMADNVMRLVLPNAHNLLRSSLLQGVALQSLLKLFKELVCCKSKKVTFDILLQGLTSIISPDLARQSYNSIAQCIAVLVANSEASVRPTVTRFCSEASVGSNHHKLLAIFVLGEIGSRIDLGAQGNLTNIITAALGSLNEEIKSAASVAFGCLAVGNMTKFLPEILSEIELDSKKRDLLLGSLREVIVRLSETREGKENLSKHFDTLLTIFFQNTAQEEEGTRNVVSECLGKLALINPETVVCQLLERTRDTNPNTRACIATAIKFTIFEKNHPIDRTLKEHIGSFLTLLNDPMIPVRRAILLSLNQLAHHKAKIIRDSLPSVLSNLYGETKVKPEHIHIVDVGVYKHKVDAGLELRLAAFECMYTLLDTCISRLDLQEFIAQLVSGLVDEYDIKVLNHLIICRLAKIAGVALLAGVDPLIEPLKTCLSILEKKDVSNSEVMKQPFFVFYPFSFFHPPLCVATQTFYLEENKTRRIEEKCSTCRSCHCSNTRL